jgi:hypothetical protein
MPWSYSLHLLCLQPTLQESFTISSRNHEQGTPCRLGVPGHQGSSIIEQLLLVS